MVRRRLSLFVIILWTLGGCSTPLPPGPTGVASERARESFLLSEADQIEKLYLAGNYRTAIRLADETNLRAMAPSLKAKIFALRGDSQRLSGNPARALVDFDQAIAMEQGLSRGGEIFSLSWVLVRKSKAYFELKNYSDVLETLNEKFVQSLQGSDSSLAEEMLSRISIQDGLPERALQQVLRSAEADPSSAHRLGRLVTQILNSFPDPQVVLELHAKHQGNPLSERLLYEAIERLWSQGGVSRARAEGIRFLQLYPLSPFAREVSEKTHGKEPLRPPHAPIIGLLVPTSGSLKPLGDQARQALELGIGRNDFRFVIEDGSGEVSSVVKSYERLVHEKRVLLVVGPLASLGSEEVAQRAEELGVPTFVVSRKHLPSSGFAFQMGLTEAQQARYLSRVWISEKGKKKFVLLGNQSPQSVAAIQLVRAEIKAQGGTILAEKTYPQDLRDFRAFLRPLAKALTEAQGVWILDSGKKAALLLSALRLQQKPGFDLFGPASWNEPQTRRFMQQFGVQAYTGDGVDLFAQSSEVRRFRDFFKKATGREPSVLDRVAYDTGVTLRKTLSEREARKSRERFRRVMIEQEELEGASGLLRFGKNGVDRGVRLIELTQEHSREGAPPSK